MKKNALLKLFDEFNKNKVKYCIRRKYTHFTKRLTSDIDMFIQEDDLAKARDILRQSNFLYYPFTEPHFFYYFYDSKIGLIMLDIVKINKLMPIKQHKNFYVPKEKKYFTIHKSFFKKIKTFLRRKIHFLFKGKLICFIGPDGSGKTSTLLLTRKYLKKFPIEKKRMYFSSLKRSDSRLYRLFDLILKLVEVHWNLLLGRIVLTDRYIYLTFRKHSFLKKLVRFIYPTPSLVYLMKARPETLRKRRKTFIGVGDDMVRRLGEERRLTIEEYKELYQEFEKIKRAKIINSEIPLSKNIIKIMEDILNLYRN